MTLPRDLNDKELPVLSTDQSAFSRVQRPPGAVSVNREASVVGDLYRFASDGLSLLPWAGGQWWGQGWYRGSEGSHGGGGGAESTRRLWSHGSCFGEAHAFMHLAQERFRVYVNRSRILRCEQSSCWGWTWRLCVWVFLTLLCCPPDTCFENIILKWEFSFKSGFMVSIDLPLLLKTVKWKLIIDHWG